MKRGAIVVDRGESEEEADTEEPVPKNGSSDEEDNHIPKKRTRAKLSESSEEDIDITEQMKNWANITEKNGEMQAATVLSGDTISSTVAFCSSTLQDLPVEVLDYILMKAVVKKVIDMKRAKSSWINCASEVIKPLRTVWSQWNDRLTMNWFKIVLHRTLIWKQPTPIRVKRIAKSPQSPQRETYECFGILNDQIYCVCTAYAEEDNLLIGSSLHVFKGHDMENCIKMIPLPSVSRIAGITICKRSKRVFLWEGTHLPWQHCPPVQCLIPDKYGGFDVRCWPTYTPPDGCLESSDVGNMGVEYASVIDDGNVLVFRGVFFRSRPFNGIISVHTPQGLVILNVVLLDCHICSNAVMKLNGNLVFAESYSGENEHFIIREVDQGGCEVDRFEWMHYCDGEVGHMWLYLDDSDRMICQSGCKTLLFLDSKLCLLEEVDVCGLGEDFLLCQAAFNKATNEMITMYGDHGFFFYKLMLDGEENQMPEQRTRDKLSGCSEEEDIETTEQIKNWSTISKKYDEMQKAVVSSTAAVTPISFTMLQDLPVEVLDYILMKAVVKKVIEKRVSKSSWINCASEMIKPLRSVGSQWDYRLTTNWFNVVLDRTLDMKQPTPITCKRIAESECHETYECFGMLNGRIYCVRTASQEAKYKLLFGSSLHVFEGHDMENCVKTVPLPPVSCTEEITICKQSKRMFLWQVASVPLQHSPPVRCLIPESDGGFEIRYWPKYAPPDDFLEQSTVRELGIDHLSVADDGNVVVLRKIFVEHHRYKNIVSIHSPEGLVMQNILLLDCDILSNIVMNSNGNLVFAEGCRHNDIHVLVHEVNQAGCEVDCFQWPHDCDCDGERMWLFLDESERVILHAGCTTLLFLDSKLRFLQEVEVCGVNPEAYLCHADFDKATNEMSSMFDKHGFLFHKLTS